MPKISFSRNTHSPLLVPTDSSLMNTLLDNGIPVASSCGGDGICGKCKVHISNGWAGITPASENEKFVLEKIKAAPNTRLSCQVLVQDDLEIDASYW